MPSFAFILPIVAGQEDLDRRTLEEMQGPRRHEYEAALREAGISRHAVWHQETPAGTFAIVYMDVQDEAAVQKFATSDASFNRWFRDQMKSVHGLDIAASAPEIKQVHDIHV